MTKVLGIHHITVAVSDIERAKEFYEVALGLRVLYEMIDPREQPLTRVYYGNGIAADALLCLVGVPRLESGAEPFAQVANVSFRAAGGSQELWERKLSQLGGRFEGTAWSFGERYLCFADPDGTEFSILIDEGRSEDNITETKISGVHSVELHASNSGTTSHLLGLLGFDQLSREGPVLRLGLSEQTHFIDLMEDTGHSNYPDRGRVSEMTWRVASFQQLTETSSLLSANGFQITEPIDRIGFRACYLSSSEGLQLGFAADRADPT